MIVVCTFLTGSVKSVQFSPDPAALQSILQNEGVKAGGPVGTTPQSSVCPPSRATSIYTVNLCSLLYFLILVTLLLLLFFCFLSAAFEIISSVFRLRECRLEKIVQKRLLCQQVRRSIAPLVIFIKPKALLSRCPFNLMWRGFFLLSSSISSTQRDGAEQMDPTESPQHQTSAPVCYGQYVFIVCWHSVQVVCCVVHNHRVNS